MPIFESFVAKVYELIKLGSSILTFKIERMKRRELLKNVGLAGVLGSVGLLAACAGNDDDANAVTTNANDAVAPQAVKSEREKLIVNRTPMSVQNPNELTKLEQKHVPDIRIGDKNDKGFTRVDVYCGKGITHPVEDNHWIDYISLHKNNTMLGTVEFEAGVVGGFASFYTLLTEGDKLIAEAGCNLHGIWTSELVING